MKIVFAVIVFKPKFIKAKLVVKQYFFEINCLEMDDYRYNDTSICFLLIEL